METQQRTFVSEPKPQTETFAAAALTEVANPSSIVLSGPIKLDLAVYRGDSGSFRVTVKDDVGAPLNLTGAAWDADIRVRPNDPTPVASFDVTPVIGDPSSIDVVLSPESSALLLVPCVYDIEMRMGDTVKTLIHGSIVLTQDVSRP